jgi:hypothetical protein
MALKKSTKRQTEKRPKRITGLEASLLSFRARNGAISPSDFAEIEKHVSPHVRKIVFARKKSKAGQKTLDRMRKVAKENVRKFFISARRTPTADLHSDRSLPIK